MNKVMLSIILMFALTQVLGVYTGALLIENSKIVPEFKEFNVSPVSDINDPINAILFFAYVLLGAVFLVMALKYYKGVMLFKIIEFMVILSASNIVFFVLLYQYSGLSFGWLVIVSVALSVLLAGGKFFLSALKNASAVISSAGVGAIFGFSIGFYPAIIFVLLLAAYDYWAVFKTKHMIKFANELGKRDLSFAVSAKETKKVKENVEVKKGIFKEVEKEVEGASMALGTGDLAIPAMLAVSAYPLGGILASFAIALGSLAGLVGTLYIVSRNRVFLPAIPPICLGGILGLLLLQIARLLIVF